MVHLNLGGPKFVNFTFNNKQYTLEDPTDFMEELLTYPEYPTEHVDLVTICLIGGMGSGKSTAIDYITNLLFKIYGEELHAFRTTDLVYALRHGVELGFVQLVIFDDAMKAGFDSRRSMSSENINMSENFALGRHLVEEKIKRGILFVIFAIQSPTRLDLFIRQNTNLTLYKSYYENLEKDVSPEDSEFVKNFTEDGMNKHKFAARRSALGISLTKKIIHFNFPREKPLINVPFIAPAPVDLIPLQNEMMNQFNIANISDKVIKGFVLKYCLDHEVKFTNKEISETISRGSYQQYLDGVELEKELERKKAEQRSKLDEFEDTCVKVLTSKFDLESEDKGVIKGSFIKYCREHKIDYNQLDYNAIFHLALLEQKTENAQKQITNPNELTLEILKYRHLLANSILKMKLETIAGIEGITAQGVQYRKKQEEKLLKKQLSKSPKAVED